MREDKLTSLFITSLVVAFFSVCGCLMSIASMLDGYDYMLILCGIFAIAFVISVIIAIIASAKLKRIQKEEYFTLRKWFTATREYLNPGKAKDDYLILKRLENLTKEQEDSKFWRIMSKGIYLPALMVSFFLLCVFMVLIYLILGLWNFTIVFTGSRTFDIVFLIIAEVIILINMLYWIPGIKKNPYYLAMDMSLNSLEFKDALREFEMSTKVFPGMWIGNDYVFVMSGGKGRIIAKRTISDVNFIYSTRGFALSISFMGGTVLKGSILPFRLLKIKEMLQGYSSNSEK